MNEIDKVRRYLRRSFTRSERERIRLAGIMAEHLALQSNASVVEIHMTNDLNPNGITVEFNRKTGKAKAERSLNMGWHGRRHRSPVATI